MRFALIIAGLLIAAAGVGAILGKFSYTSNDEVMKLGGFSATMQQRHLVPQWLGVVGVLFGGAMVVGGTTLKR